MIKEEDKWKKKLAKEQYHVLRECGTEPAFNNKYWDNKRKGVYRCAACGQPLFSSEDKFDSGTGWPSFTKPIENKNIDKKMDFRIIMPRTEVLCSRCKSHLGHVFRDCTNPEGKRFCINSAALEFKEKK